MTPPPVSAASQETPVPLLDLSAQHEALMPQLQDAMTEVLMSGKYILGPYVEKFEDEFAQSVGVEHAVGVSNGTDALLVAMMALGIGPGDEVITTPFTFFSTAGSIARLGAKPVFVDINPRTFNIEAEGIEGAITPHTKAIMPVHLFGLPANMGPIMELAKAHNLKVIEDCAQAVGADYEGQPVGSIGDVGCFSFYPSKNLPAAGDAGAVTTNDPELAAIMRAIRNHGTADGKHYQWVGGNFRLSAFQAAILSVKLPHLATYTEQRRRHAERYNRKFDRLPVGVPFEAPERHHVFHQYTIRVHGGMRDKLIGHLDDVQVGNRVYYPVPLHLQPCFKYLGQPRGSLPMSEAAAGEVLSLPVFPEMTDQQQDIVIQAVRDFYDAA